MKTNHKASKKEKLCVFEASCLCGQNCKRFRYSLIVLLYRKHTARAASADIGEVELERCGWDDLERTAIAGAH